MDHSGVCTDSDANRRAAANVTTAIESARRFPKNVFSADWNSFLFFDSDRMFIGRFADGTEVCFAEQVRALLEIDGGKSVCMMNLDQAASGMDGSRCCLFMSKTMTNEAYRSFLRGPNEAEAWLYGVDRFGCASDMGQWCIYCERTSEMAVIAFRERDSWTRFAAVIGHLEALPFKEAIEKPISFAFNPRYLIVDRRIELLREYA
jgi:hypothetical protein